MFRVNETRSGIMRFHMLGVTRMEFTLLMNVLEKKHGVYDW